MKFNEHGQVECIVDGKPVWRNAVREIQLGRQFPPTNPFDHIKPVLHPGEECLRTVSGQLIIVKVTT